MQTSSKTDLVLPTAWTEMLDQVDAGLARAEAATAARERELNEAPPINIPILEQYEFWSKKLDEWDTLMAGLETFAQQAEQKAAQTSADIQGGEEVLAEFLTALVSIRQRVESWDAERT